MPTSSRRNFLRLAGAAGGGLAFAGGLYPFTAHADPIRPSSVDMVPEGKATTIWYRTPAVEANIIQEALPVGNGRLGALIGCDPADDFVYLTDGSFWTGGRNDTLTDDGQLPYGKDDFGSFGLLAKLRIALPGHSGDAMSDYRRQLDLSNGVVSATYRHRGTRYRREVYISHPDDVVVIRLTGDGKHTGTVSLSGTHDETTSGGNGQLSIAGALGNGLRYAAAVTAASDTGKVRVDGDKIIFVDCHELLIVLCGGTDYSPDATKNYREPATDPLAVARGKVSAAAKVSATQLLNTHVADYQRLYNRFTIDLGKSSPVQRSLDSWSRIAVRYTDKSTPDPELEATYVQYGRYLTITGSRDWLPMNLQGLWVHNNNPDWYADYHTDINVQMNYWLADPAGLGENSHALAKYCVSQLPVWTDVTKRLYNNERNRFRNSTGRIAGWAIAFSTNIYGGSGWVWHPSGNAWLCNSLWRHYEYSQDRDYLELIYPVLKGAAEFWQARLITTTVTDPDGTSREALIDDSSWSPEHGPDRKGNTYAQELAWELFEEFKVASGTLHRDVELAADLAAMQDKLYMPKVSPKTGWLEEWMSPDNLGETTHRHLSPLIGLYPGDRISADTSPAALLDGVRALLTARGMDSYGWACAWRSLCWSRLKEAEKAYQLYLTILRPSLNNGNGSSANWFDMYSQGSYTIFQIDANLGGSTAALEMILYSRPDVIELLPALPHAWAAKGSVSGVGARGGFEVDLSWRNGKATEATVHSVGGTTTELRAGDFRKRINLKPGKSVTVRIS
ncbi:glycoside hydrolase family 95 protein [Streptomyces sp. NBC_01544]|uniref:glycosyl hydrolase family 95 catalytic domain-containing protein n=1 Tax=unclassified Streptomyces TaxID=2593676 RepID=UPI002ED13C82|nr:glycoside hydrolase family 95 protein [Streptomyces sp. NBC_01620]WTE64144.1 glycoside hydrolase family 95 protein [Streptomyces sp. NBC_01617]WTI91431.1 glycoside hydrolase family 95 protein [Streptomyces sp. NBC_00724]